MGHHRAAEAVARALGNSSTLEGPPLLDVLDFMSAIPRRIYRDGYLKLAQQAPTALGKLYEMSDSPDSTAGVSLRFDRALGRKLERHLERLNPAVIVSTHFLTSRIVGALKEEGRITSRLLQVVTDFDAHAYWAVKRADLICVAAEPARDRLVSLGIDPSKVVISGIPLDARFSNLPTLYEARETLGLRHDIPVVLVTLGGFGAAPYEDLFEGLAKSKLPSQFVIVCGRNESAKKRLERRVKELPPERSERFLIEGFTREMPTFMAAANLIVGKPGGLTVSEALAAGKPLILINPIPGQEERNADYLLERGAGVRCRYLEQLGGKVDSILGATGELGRRSEAAHAIGRAGAARAIAQRAQVLALDSLLGEKGTQRMALGQLIEEIRTPRPHPGTIIFDLDHTILEGDIGDAVFAELDRLGKLREIPLTMDSGEPFLEVVTGESPLDRYHRALHLAVLSNEPQAILASTYRWMSASLAGLKVDEIELATRRVWERGAIPLRAQALEILKHGLEGEHSVVIVSASNQVIVSWVVENVLNPRLEELGASSRIAPRDVWGMDNYTIDGSSCREIVLARPIHRPTLVESIRRPYSAFSGKAQLLRAAGYENILLVAGDSPNDFEMMRLADRAVWVPRLDAPQHTIAFRRELDSHPLTRFYSLEPADEALPLDRKGGSGALNS
ncbi:MAG: hypothetical protein RL417_2048 [Pseudomonadota bacterium]|jgi:processive 1,2-diacylglycerol beta-glucosyltransferase